MKIIAFQLSLFCKNYRFSQTVLYIINRIIHGCLEIPDLFLVLNMISHSFAALTREISCSTLEINLVFPRTHVLFSIYYFIHGLIDSQASIVKYRLLVKPGTPEHRNTGTPEHGTPEQHHSGTRNTGTLKILNLLKIRKKNTGGCESIAAIIIA